MQNIHSPKRIRKRSVYQNSAMFIQWERLQFFTRFTRATFRENDEGAGKCVVFSRFVYDVPFIFFSVLPQAILSDVIEGRLPLASGLMSKNISTVPTKSRIQDTALTRAAGGRWEARLSRRPGTRPRRVVLSSKIAVVANADWDLQHLIPGRAHIKRQKIFLLMSPWQNESHSDIINRFASALFVLECACGNDEDLCWTWGTLIEGW